MARIRAIKPEFFEHERLTELSPLHRLLFIGLWCQADWRGRLEDRPKRLKVRILPFDDCDIEKLLQDLHNNGFIARYEADGDLYIWIPSFSKHQFPNLKEKAIASKIPPHPADPAQTPSQTPPQHSAQHPTDTVSDTTPAPSPTSAKHDASHDASTAVTLLDGNTVTRLDGNTPCSPPAGDSVGGGTPAKASKSKKTKDFQLSGEEDTEATTLAKAADEIGDAWNEIGAPFETIRAWSEGRKRHLKARWGEKFFRENWRPALARMQKSAFCSGDNDHGWVATIDWFLKPDTVPRLLEGKYDRTRKAKAAGLELMKPDEVPT